MVRIDTDKCIGCGSCVKDCTSRMIRMEEGKARVLGECFECGHCLCVCPVNAVTMEGYRLDEVEEIPPQGAALDPDALLRAIKCRRSIRQYKDRPVEREKLLKIIEAARFSPTGSNLQDVGFVVLQEQLPQFTALTLSLLKDMGEALLALPTRTPQQERYAKRWSMMEGEYQTKNLDRLFFHAPAVLVFTGREDVNPALAASKAELMANALGLGCVYIGFFRAASDQPKLRQALGLEEGRRVVCALALGYPDVRYFRSAPRKERDIRFL